jgi:hypothetical protein
VHRHLVEGLAHSPLADHQQRRDDAGDASDDQCRGVGVDEADGQRHEREREPVRLAVRALDPQPVQLAAEERDAEPQAGDDERTVETRLVADERCVDGGTHRRGDEADDEHAPVDPACLVPRHDPTSLPREKFAASTVPHPTARVKPSAQLFPRWDMVAALDARCAVARSPSRAAGVVEQDKRGAGLRRRVGVRIEP